MKIQYKNNDSIPSFEIIPTADRKIIRRFVDKETHHLVVCESNVADPSDHKIYYTLIDQKTGKIIPILRRSEEVEASGKEQLLEDKQHGLRLHTLHVVNPQTGDEELQQTLTEVATGRVVAQRWSSAFSEQPRETLLAAYLVEQSKKNDRDIFWTQDYPQWSFERRTTYWFDSMLKQMRFQSEAGFDEYASFTPQNYAEWKDREPDIDRILEFVIDHIPGDSEEFRTEVYRRLGKSQA